MKKLIALPLFHLFFWAGDLTSMALRLFKDDPEGRWYEPVPRWMVEFYSWSMRQSLRLDTWASLGKWTPAA